MQVSATTTAVCPLMQLAMEAQLVLVLALALARELELPRLRSPHNPFRCEQRAHMTHNM